jgi:zinc protease
MKQVLPSVTGYRLQTGLELRTVEMPSLPIVSFAIVLRAGSDKEPDDRAGLSHLTASSLDTGTTSSDVHALADRIEYFGTSLQGSPMHDAVILSCSTLRSHLNDVLAIAGEILCSATFPDHEVGRLQSMQKTTILQMQDRPGARASNALDRLLFGETHPYGRPVIGRIGSVEQLTSHEVKEYFRSRYRPSGALAIATGDITSEMWRALCETHLGSWTGRADDFPAPRVAEGKAGRRIFLIDRPATPQAEVRVGCVAMPRNHPDFLAATVLNHVLGGQFTSRLNVKLREQRGLTYGAWSAFSVLRNSGTFIMGGAFETPKADEAILLLVEEARRIALDGISQEELLFAQHSMTGGFLRIFETPSQVCGRVQGLYTYDLPDDYYHTYVERLTALTLKDIVQVAQRWLIPERFVVVIVGDAGALRPKLELLDFEETILYADV